MEISAGVLEGQHIRLEPLSSTHTEALILAAADGELWTSTVTIIPRPERMMAYVKAALQGQARKQELPFVIIRPQSGQVVGTTRFYNIRSEDRATAIGCTWLCHSSQRTAVNTECKLLLLSHAFEFWNCVRVEFITDVLNEQSRAAILRLGAKQEGILRNHMIMPNGRVRDSVVFSIIKGEWPEIRRGLLAKLEQTA